MNNIIGISGYSGSGKTSLCGIIAKLFGAARFYAGDIVLRAIADSGLEPTRENEIVIRKQLREQHGLGALVITGQSQLEATLKSNKLIVFDAIFTIEEYKALQELNPYVNVMLLAIEASFETRCHRLSRRLDRPLLREQLHERDAFEREYLGLATAISQAHHIIANEDDLTSLEHKVFTLLKKIN